MTTLEGKALLDHGKAIARRYAGRVGSDVAEELGAEAVLRALRSPPPDGHLEPWLERIYRNLFVDMWRRRRSATVDIADLPELSISGTPEEAVLGGERRRVVRASLTRLPRESRRALLSRYYAELDDDVSATRLGIASATIRTRIHRALGRLRDHLGDLRGLLMPVFGKLGSGVAAFGLAPVMIAALAVVSVPPRAPEVEAGSRASDHHVAQLAPVIVPSAQADALVTAAEPRPRAHVAARVRVSAPPAESPPTQVITFADQEEVVVDIQQPEAINIFADPVKAAPPSLVEIPTNFLAQIDKMVEESL
jgi:RNA polymerase sigma-70 factor (ECF subfamily)